MGTSGYTGLIFGLFRVLWWFWLCVFVGCDLRDFRRLLFLGCLGGLGVCVNRNFAILVFLDGILLLSASSVRVIWGFNFVFSCFGSELAKFAVFWVWRFGCLVFVWYFLVNFRGIGVGVRRNFCGLVFLGRISLPVVGILGLVGWCLICFLPV